MWALVAQTVKNLPAVQETQVQSLGREDPLEKEMATPSSTVAWKIPWMEENLGYSSWGHKESDTTKQFHFHLGRRPGLIPGSRRSDEEGIGYPLQYSWTFHVAQLVKNTSAVRETWVLSLGWEDLLEKGKATHSSILAWRIP